MLSKKNVIILILLLLNSCSFRSEIYDLPNKIGPCESKVGSKIKKILSLNLDVSYGPPLNSFIYINPQALEEARKLDEVASHGQKGDLHCWVVVVKDNIDTYDMPTTAGTLAMLGSQPNSDALLVANLRASGAVIIGKSSMDELSNGVFGVSSRHGRTGNAYDTHQSSGGSSAGSAVSVAAGFADLGIGTDNSGSIRIPAIFNGLVGLRPTKGLLSEKGLFPRGHIDGVPGPIAVDAQSIAIAMDSMIGNSKKFRNALALDALKDKRIGIVHSVGRYDVFKKTSHEFDRAFENLKNQIQSLDASLIQDISFPKFDSERSNNTAGDMELINTYFESFISTRQSFRDLCQSNRVGFWTVDQCLESLNKTPKLGSKEYKQILSRISQNQKYVHEIMESQKLDALLLPVSTIGYSAPGFEHFNGFQASLASNAALPGIGFVIGYTDKGLPIGVELIGKSGSDTELVSYVHSLEPKLPPYRKPPIVEPKDDKRIFTIQQMNSLITELGSKSLSVMRKNDSELGADVFEHMTKEHLIEFGKKK